MSPTLTNSPRERFDAKLLFAMSPDMKQAVILAAHQRLLAEADIIREAITSYLSRDPQPPPVEHRHRWGVQYLAALPPSTRQRLDALTREWGVSLAALMRHAVRVHLGLGPDQ